jgi:hypothetical protein
MESANQDSPNSARRGYVAVSAFIISTIVLVTFLPMAAPLGGVGLVAWGMATMRKPGDRPLRALGVAAVSIGSLLLLLTLGVLLTQFRVG